MPTLGRSWLAVLLLEKGGGAHRICFPGSELGWDNTVALWDHHKTSPGSQASFESNFHIEPADGSVC